MYQLHTYQSENPLYKPPILSSPSPHLTHHLSNTEQASRLKEIMTWSVEVETSVSASRMFKAAILNWHNLGPKVAPEVIVSGTGVEGEGGVGSVRELKFTSVMPFSYIKQRLDFVDHEKFECKATIIEGGHLGTKLESASVHFKIEPTASGGCVVKVVMTSKVIAGVEVKDDIEKAKESVVKNFKAAEAYLVANPTAYA